MPDGYGNDSMDIVRVYDSIGHSAASAKHQASLELRYMMAAHVHEQHGVNLRSSAKQYGIKWKDLRDFLETGGVK